MMRQHIKLSAVLVVVVLALTGFSTSSHGGRSGKSKSSGSSSGGGCSNSKKSNNGYHSSDYDDDDYDSSSSSSGSTDYGTPTPTATASDEPEAYAVRCAQPRKGKRKAVTASTVRLTADAGATGSHTYEVDVTFLDARGNTVDTGDATVDAEGGETKTVSVRMDNPRKVSKVKDCRVDAELSY
ncbi:MULTISPECIES: hypothetical protein [Streptomyces]|uniref:hypothetical protein n=1 Tax=Streptomyces TaxID=1883 RepID=UPI000F5BC4CA|nr:MULTISPECIES: hypothetical protein [Streptomyces]WSG52619.1 hypothetical protein OHA38_24145 [Streptomyces sp. NBC_01732]WSX03256.1 hypothetical protein OG355_24175 [Streptomyces sp. NBC_00987]MCT2542745.1 hypothetical protein [Streptomyces atratus]MCX4394771.1 hypothetical protein [Streptomyces sp. NBC_01767]MCX5102576.1 hypothetical protein [Streptomyces sp. NBC_00439]